MPGVAVGAVSADLEPQRRLLFALHEVIAQGRPPAVIAPEAGPILVGLRRMVAHGHCHLGSHGTRVGVGAARDAGRRREHEERSPERPRVPVGVRHRLFPRRSRAGRRRPRTMAVARTRVHASDRHEGPVAEAPAAQSALTRVGIVGLDRERHLLSHGRVRRRDAHVGGHRRVGPGVGIPAEVAARRVGAVAAQLERHRRARARARTGAGAGAPALSGRSTRTRTRARAPRGVVPLDAPGRADGRTDRGRRRRVDDGLPVALGPGRVVAGCHRAHDQTGGGQRRGADDDAIAIACAHGSPLVG